MEESNYFAFIRIIGFLIPLLVAVILHEVAHGWMAFKLGDPTAKVLGRITLNPIKHIDPMMTIILPGILILSGSPFIFGGAKPVPVNPLNFKHPRRGMAYVAMAGPITNFILAIIALMFGKILFSVFPQVINLLPPQLSIILLLWIAQGFLINVILGLFNLLPIPPLDGGRIAVGFLPLPLARKLAGLERWGLVIVMGLLFSGTLDKVLDPIARIAENILRNHGFPF